MNKVSVISLISYDYELLLKSLPTYIDLVDEVILGLDRERVTWAGNSFPIPDSFFTALKKIDPDTKIKIIEDKFFVDGQSARDLDTRERNILSTHAQSGSWLLSIDADEILLNVKQLVTFLRNYSDENVCIFGNWITLFKQSGDRLFVIENAPMDVERFPLATKKANAFTYCRNTEQRTVLSSACAIHFSWARTRDELERKLRNWTHRDDFVVEDFLSRWDALNEESAQTFIDFHPFEPKMWQRLLVVKESELENFAEQKANEFNAEQAWAGVVSQAKVGLLESKIIKRDQLAATAKAESDAKIADLKRQLAEAQTASNVWKGQAISQTEFPTNPNKSSNFLSGLFKSKT